MNPTFSGLINLAVQTVREPRLTFSQLRTLDLPRQALWEGLVLVVALSVLLAEIGNMILLAGLPDDAQPTSFLSPFVLGGMQFGIFIVTIFLIDWIGRMMGGTGDLDGAILSIVWLQAIMVMLQVVQTVLFILAPPIAGLAVIVGLGLFLYLLAAFVAELHGFASVGRTFAMILFVLMGVALGLSFILTLIGVTVPR
ncbi:Yip1 domain protein [Rhodobacteraceae bacterium THAF1]|uniref:YIP1 family protein n=1 Tax=Palleronia sp. THAF1 TaxID=2587842 RepID=UPI000F3D7FCF|nr:YIP1 family protein [Palleronia sp. THAF1]QFU08533.1 Yip1 domain protein [Palleronia sp. THAF1]VDC30583.1 Yip1 domain protein [Rhodobacteraceae bacterium THAF1]